jgi:6-methylsalicylic acid synthase
VIATASAAAESGDPPEAPGLALVKADPELVGQRLAAVGVPETGFNWTVEELLRGEGGLRAHVRCGPAATWAPALDAAMSVAPSAFPGDPALRMVVHVEGLVTVGDPPPKVQLDVWLDADKEDTVQVLISDSAGSVVGWLSGLRYPVIDVPTAGDMDADSANPGVSLADLGPDELRAVLIEEIGTLIAEEMRLAPADLSPRRPLVEQGLDSLLTVVIRRRLEKRFRCSLPATLLWRQPTIAAIADHMANLLSTSDAVEATHAP